MALATNTTPGSVILAGDLTGSANAPSLRPSGVVSGNHTPVNIVVDAKGRLIYASVCAQSEVAALSPIATHSVKGIMAVDDEALAVTSGVLSFAESTPTTPGSISLSSGTVTSSLETVGGVLRLANATQTTVGMVTAGAGMTINGAAQLDVVPATTSTIGGVRGDTITVIVGQTGNAFLPAATTTTLGSISAGSGLAVASDGTLYVDTTALTKATSTAYPFNTLGAVKGRPGVIEISEGNISVGPLMALLDRENNWISGQGHTLAAATTSPVTPVLLNSPAQSITSGSTINTPIDAAYVPDGTIFHFHGNVVISAVGGYQDVLVGGDKTLASPTGLPGNFDAPGYQIINTGGDKTASSPTGITITSQRGYLGADVGGDKTGSSATGYDATVPTPARVKLTNVGNITGSTSTGLSDTTVVSYALLNTTTTINSSTPTGFINSSGIVYILTCYMQNNIALTKSEFGVYGNTAQTMGELVTQLNISGVTQGYSFELTSSGIKVTTNEFEYLNDDVVVVAGALRTLFSYERHIDQLADYAGTVTVPYYDGDDAVVSITVDGSTYYKTFKIDGNCSTYTGLISILNQSIGWSVGKPSSVSFAISDDDVYCARTSTTSTETPPSVGGGGSTYPSYDAIGDLVGWSAVSSSSTVLGTTYSVTVTIAGTPYTTTFTGDQAPTYDDLFNVIARPEYIVTLNGGNIRITTSAYGFFNMSLSGSAITSLDGYVAMLPFIPGTTTSKGGSCTIDGEVYYITVIDAYTQTYGELIDRINQVISAGGVADIYGGNIRIVSNTVGAGSTVSVSFPFSDIAGYVSTGTPVDGTSTSTYSAVIKRNGVNYNISVTNTTDTYTKLQTEIQNQCSGLVTVTMVDGNLRIRSTTTGPSGTIEITPGTLFPALQDYTGLGVPFTGVNSYATPPTFSSWYKFNNTMPYYHTWFKARCVKYGSYAYCSFI